MNTAALERAIKTMVISDVYVREATIRTRPEYDPKRRDLKMGMQIRHLPMEEGHWVQAERDGTPVKVVRLLMNTGVRLVDVTDSETEALVAQGRVVSDDKVCGELTAVFVAEYILRDDVALDEEAIQEFVKHNVMYHVWPYWRELAQTAFARMRFPEVVLPMFRVAKPEPKSSQAPSESDAKG